MAARKIVQKTTFMPKARVQTWRRELYDKAFALRQKANPDLTLSEWMREAFDAQATLDLEKQTTDLRTAAISRTIASASGRV